MKTPLAALCAVIALAPLPLASVGPVSWGVIGLFCGTLMVLSGLQIVRGATMPAVGWSAPLFTMVIVWIVLQTASLPLVAHPLWTEASHALGLPESGSVSLDRTATPTILIRLLTYASVLWLAMFHCRDTSQANAAFYIVAAAGSLYALYGVIEFSVGNEHILWYPKTDYLDSLSSTFINRNSFATYVGLTLICTTGLIAQSLSSRLPLTKITVLTIAWFIQCLALFLTASRAGGVSTILGIIVVIIVVMIGRIGSQRQRIGFMAGLLIAISFACYQGGDFWIERLQTGSLDRGQVFRLTGELIEQTPFTGTGYGTFEDAFRMHRDETVNGTYDKAHNTYLEEALELGIPATVLLLSSVTLLIITCGRGLSRNNPNRLLCAIGIGTSVLVGVHSLVDFSIQIPAVAVTFCFILGTAVAQSKKI